MRKRKKKKDSAFVGGGGGVFRGICCTTTSFLGGRVWGGKQNHPIPHITYSWGGGWGSGGKGREKTAHHHQLVFIETTHVTLPTPPKKIIGFLRNFPPSDERAWEVVTTWRFNVPYEDSPAGVFASSRMMGGAAHVGGGARRGGFHISLAA